jgi:hypothetical protein
MRSGPPHRQAQRLPKFANTGDRQLVVNSEHIRLKYAFYTLELDPVIVEFLQFNEA